MPIRDDYRLRNVGTGGSALIVDTIFFESLMFWNILECFGMVWNVLGCFSVFLNVAEYF